MVIGPNEVRMQSSGRSDSCFDLLLSRFLYLWLCGAGLYAVSFCSISFHPVSCLIPSRLIPSLDLIVYSRHRRALLIHIMHAIFSVIQKCFLICSSTFSISLTQYEVYQSIIPHIPSIMHVILNVQHSCFNKFLFSHLLTFIFILPILSHFSC